MKTIRYIFIFFLISLSVYSQGGSNYSIFGIGELTTGVGASYDGLAGTSIAIPFETSINTKNPAMWSFLNTTRIQAGYRFNQQLVSNQTTNLYQNNGKVDGILMNFSIDSSLGIDIGLGFSSYSAVNYLMSTKYKVDEGGLSTDGQIIYQGFGGLTQGYLGASFRPFPRFSIGVAVFSLFGNIGNTVSTYLFDNNAFPSKSQVIDGFSSLGFRYGLSYNPFGNLYLGASMESHSFVNINRVYTIYATRNTNDSTYSRSLKIDIPDAVGIGLSYKFDKIIVGAEANFQDFSKFDFNSSNSMKFRKMDQYTFGISFLGNKTWSVPTLERLTYNIGFGIKNGYIEVNNTPIKEIYGSVGFIAPIVGYSSLDAALTIGNRGTKDNGLIREFFTRLTVSLSLGDIWFQPFKREY